MTPWPHRIVVMDANYETLAPFGVTEEIPRIDGIIRRLIREIWEVCIFKKYRF